METEFAVSLGSQRWTLPADSDTFTIGRGSNADIRLPSDDQISRIHARLNRTGTTWTLVDESRNGTALNGRRLAAPTELTDNDRIHIGRSVLTFHEEVHAAPADRPAPEAAAVGNTPPAPAPPHSPAPAPTGVPGASAPADASGGFPGASAPPDAPAGASARADAPAGVPDASARADAPAGVPDASARADAPAGVPDASARADAPAGVPGASAQADAPAGVPDASAQADAPVDSPFRESGAQPADAGPSYSVGGDGDGREQPFWGDAQQPARDYDVPDLRQPDDMYDQIIGAEPGRSPFAPDAPENQEWVGGARVGWVDPEGGPASGAAWAAYPSADNPEPARSPWTGTARPTLTPPEGGQPNWSESAGWPESAFEQPERQAQPERQPEPVRRKPEPAAEPRPGHVRLVRVLLVAAAVLGLGLVLNLVASFFIDGTGGTLRWLVPPTIALVAAMVVALIDGFSSENRPAGGRLDVPVVIAIVVVLLGVGVGGFALTAGAEYLTGYVTGKESGVDRLLKPVTKTGAGLTVTVENVTYTSHFTRVEVVVSNGGDQSLAFPHSGLTFTGADGVSLKADGFRSDWPDSVAAGNVERGTIIFTGHLPEGLTTATLNLKSGDTTVAIPVALSN